MHSELANTVEVYLQKIHITCKDTKIVVGLSGGADSIALLYVLKELAFPLFAVHIHHGIRDEADRDEALCKRVCERFQIPYKVIYVDAPLYAKINNYSLEDAARRLRYGALEEARTQWNAEYIAVAHHRDDQAETLLHHFLRGSGSQGLAGMRSINGRILRPFLSVCRNEIIEYLNSCKAEFVFDESNADNYYTRNSLRNELLPWIKERYNPNIVDNLSRMSEIFAQENDYLEEEARKKYQSIHYWKNEILYIDLDECEKIHIALLRRIFRLGLEELLKDTKNLGFTHVESIIALMKRTSGKRVDVIRGITVVREYQQLIFTKEDKKLNYEEAYFCPLDTQGDKGYIQEAGIYFALELLEKDVYDQEQAAINIDQLQMNYKDSFKNEIKVYTKSFDYDKIKANLVLRTRKAGDRIRINKNGDSKSIKKFFIDEKIQASLRNSIPLLTIDHQVLWIVDYRVDPFYEVDQDTKKVLRVELSKEDNNGSNN